MTLVAFLKGVNVGGHRTFRPSVLAQDLRRFDVINVGAAGTFVVRKPISRTDLRAEIRRRLPFEAHITICSGSDILRLMSSGDPFGGHVAARDIVQFVGVMARRRPALSALPLNLPETEWRVKVLACQGPFVLGLHRRELKAIRYLGELEKVFDSPLTIRGWNTLLSLGRILTG